jgi:Ca2+-binding EF-hand superfamily protein
MGRPARQGLLDGFPSRTSFSATPVIMKTIAVLCSAALSLTLALNAQNAPKSSAKTPPKTMTADETFRWYDDNNDGAITREEFIAKPLMPGAPPTMVNSIADTLMKKDANGDGKVSKEEWDAAGRKSNEARFNMLDGNKDGFLSKEEALTFFKGDASKADPMIKGLDKDADGKVSKAEWLAPPAKKTAK